ncbi:MAG: 1-acyl-sn-glycerol-3-phosphate acyltransferase [Bacteroidia bacterium]|nr:1-acyl-sn-glycerol-3-phosphate acyltransferase [Bacteroidia bacterium]
MKYLLRPFQWIYTIYVVAMFFITMVPIVFIYLFLSLVPRNPRMIWVFRVNIVWLTIWGALCGIFMVTRGQEKIKKGKQYVILSNHVNMMDMIMLGSRLVHPFQPLIKKELLRIPLFGFLLRITSIPIDRSSGESRKAGFKTMVRRIETGTSILIFPEGTRNRASTPLAPFYLGAFRLAVATQTPIVPIVLVNMRRVQKPGQLLIKPGIVTFQILDPIPTAGMEDKDVKPLLDKVHKTYWDYLLEHDGDFKGYQEERELVFKGK